MPLEILNLKIIISASQIGRDSFFGAQLWSSQACTSYDLSKVHGWPMAIKPSFDTITLAWEKANISDKLSFRDMTVCRPPTASDQEITRLLTILKTRSGLLVGFESFKIWYLMSITHINISTHNYAPIFFSYVNCPGSTHLTTSASCNQLLLTQWQSSQRQTPTIGVIPPYPNKALSLN